MSGFSKAYVQWCCFFLICLTCIFCFTFTSRLDYVFRHKFARWRAMEVFVVGAVFCKCKLYYKVSSVNAVIAANGNLLLFNQIITGSVKSSQIL